jgi:hypothetical protein
VLNPYEAHETAPRRDRPRERRLWHDVGCAGHLGCAVCPERSICGGLGVQAHLFDCLGLCCGRPEKCDNVCRNHPDYADRVREINTFGLSMVPRTGPISSPQLPPVIPVLFHGSRREQLLKSRAVAMPLYSMFNRRDGSVRYGSRDALCLAYGVSTEALVLLTGTDYDAPLERWWSFGESKRRSIIRSLLKAGISLVTTPNYSLFTDVPRWNDLHSMKRIALVHHEFMSEGLLAALHVNGRTATDFSRWAAYLVARPEITHLAYEFGTGTGWAGRLQRHAEWLCELTATVGRPLHLLVRGGIEVLPQLALAFGGITLLDTSSFIKSVKRQRASLNGNSALKWLPAPTIAGEPIDDLLIHNIQAVSDWTRMRTGNFTVSK